MLVVLGLVSIYSWWVSELRSFTWPSLLAVEGAGLAAIALARWRRTTATTATPGPVPASRRWSRGVELWLGLVLLLGLWELSAYLQHPRSDHPTLSSLVDELLAAQPVRAVAFAAWLCGAYGLARR
jgi:hypothetical protein